MLPLTSGRASARRRAIVLIQATVLAVSLAVAPAAPIVAPVAAADASLVGYWSMDETSGTTAHDTGAAPANDATTVASPTWVAGKNANALHFNGTTQYATAADDASLDITGAITVAAWVKPEMVGSAAIPQLVVQKALTGSTNGYEIGLTGATSTAPQKAYIRFNNATDGDAHRAVSTTTYPTDGSTWIHIAGTYDGTTVRLYYNGALQGSVAWTGTIAANNLAVGIGGPPMLDTARLFKGAIDDVRIYSRALSATEVAALYSPPVNRAPVAVNDGFATDSNTVLNVAAPGVLGNDTDADGNPLTAVKVTDPGHGAVTLNANGSFTYTPATDYTGSDSFTYTANDGSLDSNVATVDLTVNVPGADVVMVGAGDIADGGVGASQTAALISALPTATVFTLGDNAYPEGTATDFANNYDPTWGAFKARTYPSVGNHDWANASTGYFPYFGASRAGSPNGYYSYDLGSYWHVVVLNTEIDYSVGSAQELWLRADLAANASKNVVAYFHRPRFDSGATHGTEVADEAIWRDLYEFGADLVLNGHEHWYERFAPQTPDGVADPTYGIREIVAGTGGGPRYSVGTIDPNSEVRDGSTWGVLKLTLHQSSYDWEFLPVAGGTFTDSGTAAVHAAPPPITNHGIHFDGSNDYVTFGEAPGLNAATFTLETWFNWTGGGTSSTTGTGGIDLIPLLTKGAPDVDNHDNNDEDYILGITPSGHLAADFEEGAAGANPSLNHPVEGSTTITTNTWHHAAATYDGTTWKLYLDGALDATLAVGQPPRSDTIQHAGLGTMLTSTDTAKGFFQGVLDEARIWNLARSQGDIQATMDNEVTSGSGLVARWGMNEGSGPSIASSVGTFPGTLTNGPTWVAGFVPVGSQEPVCSNVSLSTPVDTAADIAPACTDANNDPLTYSVVAPATHGTASVFGTLLHYVPDAAYTGDDSFTYKANDGALDSNVATVTVTVTPAITNHGIHFDGSNDYVTFGEAPGLNAATFTLETWFNWTGGGTSSTTGTGGIDLIPLLTKGAPDVDNHDNNDEDYILGITPSGHLAADFEEGAAGANPSLNHPVEGSTTITTNTWHHAAATYDGTTWKLYLDGALDATLAVGQPPRSDTIQHAGLGTMLTSTDTAKGFFQGVLDEARIWNLARSQGDIQATMDNEVTSGSGLVARWGMNEGSGPSIASSVGTFPGTLTNGPTWVAGSPFVVGNHPPAAPTNPSPAGGATGVSTSPTLSVDVAPDPDGDPQTVTFFGRPTAGVSDQPFTFVVLPDTQNYSSTYPSIFSAQTQWIAANASALNIAFVSHLGDIVENGDTNASEWTNASAAIQVLDTAGIPYSMAVGNHDGYATGYTRFASTFPVSRFAGKSWYGGYLGDPADGINDFGQNRGDLDSYGLFSQGGRDFIVLSLELDSPIAYHVADWADAVLSAYSTRTAIVVIHTFITTSGARDTSTYALGSAGLSPEALWQTVLRNHCNVLLVVNGHYPGEAELTSNNSCGQPVHQVLSDYQNQPNGGDGWLRYYTFTPATNSIEARTYRVAHDAVTSQFQTDANSQFSLAWDAGTSGSGAYAEIGTAPVTGGSASVVWPGLGTETGYDWHAVASDGIATTPSATWSFTTGTSGPTSHTLHGTVTAGGSGVDGALVHVFLADTYTYVGNTTTASDGTYSLSLPAGTYKLYVQPTNAPGYPDQWDGGTDFASAAVADLTLGDATADVALLALAENHTLHGTVTAGGSGVDGALVHVFLAGTYTYVGNTTAASDGTYSLSLPAGTYKLYVQPTNAPGYPDQWDGGTDFASAAVADLTLGDATADVALLALAENHTLHGTVTAGGSGVDGALVHVFLAGTYTYVGNTTAASDGTYSLSLPAGTYKLYVQPTNAPGYPDQWDGGTDFASAAVADLTLGDATADVALLALAENHTLHGTVTAGGSGVDGALVHVFLAGTYTYVGNTTAASDGTYSLSLPAGTYKLYVQPTNAPGYPDQWDGGTDFASAAVADLTLGDATADVALLALAENHTPVCSDTALTTPANTPGDVAPSCTDPDNDTLSYAIVDQPAHGTASVVGGLLHYVPAGAYTGDDSFTYQASDGYLDSNTATVDVTVTPPPTNFGLQFDGTNDYVTFGQALQLDASPFTVETWFKWTGGGTSSTTGTGGIPDLIPLVAKGAPQAEGSNVDADYILGIRLSTKHLAADFEDMATGLNHPVEGATAITLNTWHHAAATYDGTTWRLYLDGILDQTLVVGAFTPRSDSIQHAALGTMLTSTGATNGFFAGVLDEARIWNVAQSAAQIKANRDLELTSGTGLIGRWGLNEGTGTTIASSVGTTPGTLTNGPAWVSGFVPQVNVAPVCVDGTLTTPANTPGDVAPSCTDANGNPISYAIVDQPAHGTASVVGGLLHYVPAGAYTGDDSFTYQASDGYLDSNTATVDVTVTPPPTNFGLQFDGTNDYVTFGQALQLDASPFTVETWFKWTGGGTSSTTGTGGIPDLIPLVAKGAPQAEGSNVDADYILGIRLSTKHLAADFEDMATGLNHPVEGATAITLNTWHHAAATYDGTTWRLYLDGILDQTLVVGAFTPRSDSIQHAALGTMLTSTGATNGFFAGVLDEARIWNVAQSAAQIKANRDLELTSGTGLIGRWGLNEGTGTTIASSVGTTPGTLTNGPAWVSGFVPQVNVAPVCVDGTLTTPANTPGDVAPSCTDANGNPISYAIVDQPAHGTASVVGGLLHYVPAGAYTGDDSFTYQASDGYLDSNTATVDVTVTPPPTNFGLQFDGTNDYVTFGQALQLDASPFTVETWFKWTGGGTSSTTGTGGIPDLIPLVAKGAPQAEGSNVDADYILGIRLSTKHLAADFEDMATGLNHPVEGATAITLNTWHHAAATYDGTTWRLYLDGILDQTLVVGAFTPRSDSIQHAALGTMLTSTGATNGFFAGVLDEARIWNVAQSAAQIKANRDLELTSGTGLIGRWGLNEGTGTTIASSVGTTPGTLTNGPAWVSGFVPQVNVAPVCVDGTLTTPANTPGDVAPSCTDANGNPISYAIVDQPAHGTASVVGGLLHYVPAGAYTGDDSFTYQASDGYLDSNTATVDVTVTPPPTNFGLQFDGTNDYVTFGQATSTLGVTTFTLEAWVKRSTTSTGATMTTGSLGLDGTAGRPLAYPVLTKGMGQGETPPNINMNYFLGITSTGYVGADFEDNAGGVNHPAWGTMTVSVGVWHHIAATYDGSCWSLYFDGAPDTLNSAVVQCPNATPEKTSIQHAALATGLNSTGGTSTGFFAGAIDEARIWNYARSAAEIAATMDLEAIGTEDGLLGRWGLNDDAGLTAANSVAGSPAGTLTNGPTWTTGFVP